MQPYALTLDHFIDHAAKWHGATEVVTGGCGGSAPHRLCRRCASAAAACRARSRRSGSAQGDHLGVLAWNSQAHMECWYGAMGVGIVCHTLNPRLSPRIWRR